ncbi:MAG: hypothetical protein AB4041_00920 [Microcystaceae cyanobacterium]
MNSPQDLSLLLKTQISLTQLRDDLHVFNYPDDQESVGALCYIERSLNTLINQIAEKTDYTEVVSYSKEEFMMDDEDEDWESSPTIPLKPGEIDQICHILESEV